MEYYSFKAFSFTLYFLLPFFKLVSTFDGTVPETEKKMHSFMETDCNSFGVLRNCEGLFQTGTRVGGLTAKNMLLHDPTLLVIPYLDSSEDGTLHIILNWIRTRVNRTWLDASKLDTQ